MNLTEICARKSHTKININFFSGNRPRLGFMQDRRLEEILKWGP